MHGVVKRIPTPTHAPQRMAPDHKFSAQAKLVAEVLGGVADGALPLSECEEVLGDALRLLSSREFRVTASKLSGPVDDLEAEVGGCCPATTLCTYSEFPHEHARAIETGGRPGGRGEWLDPGLFGCLFLFLRCAHVGTCPAS